MTTTTCGELTLHEDRGEVEFGDGRLVELTKTETSLLAYFMANPNQVLSRDQIRSQVWGSPHIGHAVVDNYICYLRRKLGAEHIQTRRGFGFVWRS